MRVRLAATLVVLALIILLARRANASCAVEQAYLAQTSLPAGCKLQIYIQNGETTPTVVALRGGQRVNVTGAATSEAVSLPIFLETDHCTGTGMTSAFPMTLVSIELANVVAGDTLELEGVTAAQTVVTAATTCSAPVQPDLFCADDTPETCDDDIVPGKDDGGCNAGGSAALGAALALLGLLRRHRCVSRRRA